MHYPGGWAEGAAHDRLKQTLRALPSRRIYRFKNASEMYGAPHVAAEYLGLNRPRRIRNRTWQHGWVSPGKMVDPLAVTMGQGKTRSMHLVARQEEALYLQKHGYRSTSIGLPFAYALATSFATPNRVPHSVLVLPTHSSRLKLLADARAVHSFFEWVTRQISDKSCVTVCLHDEDLRTQTANSAWLHSGFKIVAGARVDDANSLKRMAFLFSCHETVVVDHCGSSIPMALACGSQIAVFRHVAPPRYESLRHERHEDAAVPLFATQEWLKRTRPELFCDLKDAVSNAGWGREQIGAANVLSREKLMKSLGWKQACQRSAPPTQLL